MLHKTRKMHEAEEILAQRNIHQPLDQYITSQLNAGISFNAIAKDLGISNGSLSYWVAKMNIQKRYGPGQSNEQKQV